MIAADQQGTFDTDPSTSCTWKRQRYADNDYGEPQLRWRQMMSVARGCSGIRRRTVGSTIGNGLLIIKNEGERVGEGVESLRGKDRGCKQ
jgi:hypothetical protein